MISKWNVRLSVLKPIFDCEFGVCGKSDMCVSSIAPLQVPYTKNTEVTLDGNILHVNKTGWSTLFLINTLKMKFAARYDSFASGYCARNVSFVSGVNSVVFDLNSTSMPYIYKSGVIGYTYQGETSLGKAWSLVFPTSKGNVLARVTFQTLSGGFGNVCYTVEIQVPKAFKSTGLLNGICGNYNGVVVDDTLAGGNAQLV